MIGFFLLATFIDIPDTSNLSLRNPDLKERTVAKIALDNGLEAVLISDPQADQSAAALAVHAGSMMDPSEYPGMAHFCEHLLFLGTHTYPTENEFHRLVADYSGHTNAGTWPEKTVYYFSSSHEGFNPLLERWAHFFIDPLFDPSGVAREMHAIDQEFSRHFQENNWREHFVCKELANPAHPYSRFTTGNSKTLAKVPPDAVRAWHDTWYRAPRMRLLVYSNRPLEELKASVDTYFSAIPSGPTPTPTQHRFLSNEQIGHITYVQPVQETRLLTLRWEISPQLGLDPSQPAELVAYALNRGQKASLIERLKEEGLADELVAVVDDLEGNEQRLFEIQVKLTEQGLQEIPQVTLRCFEALAAYRKQGIPAYLFEERNRASRLLYEYQPRSDAFEFVNATAPLLFHEELATFPLRQVAAARFDKKKIDLFLDSLSPSNCAFCVLADPAHTGVSLDRKEQWLGTAYAVRPLPATWLAWWQKASPHSQIAIAPPNAFLSDSLASVEGPSGASPSLLSQVPGGTAYYWRGAEFGNPEISFHLHFLSPALTPDPRSAVLTDLYLDHLERELSPTFTAAAQAGLKASVGANRNRITLEISGLSASAPLLLQETLKELRGRPLTEAEFRLASERLRQFYAQTLQASPLYQALSEFRSLAQPHRIPTLEKEKALATLHYGDYLMFHNALWEKAYIDALFSGNLSVQAAEAAWLDIQSLLVREPYLRAEHSPIQVLSLPEAQGPYQIAHPISTYGNAAMLILDGGEIRPSLSLLDDSLHEAFFSELRTKQKTGYVAAARAAELDGRFFEFFLVESNSHQPDDLLYRFELFLETYREELATHVSSERFDLLKRSALDTLQNQYRSLNDRATLWDQLAFEKGGNFAYLEEQMAALSSLSYETFLQESRAFLSRDNRRRLALLLTGQTDHPFTYQAIAPTTLREVASYISSNQTASPAAAPEEPAAGAL